MKVYEDELTAIEVKNLSIEYKVSKYNYNSFKEWALQGIKRRNSHKIVHALKNVSFSITKGESVALIGHNGSGKSTLLKAIAGVIVDPGATLQLRGRVAPLIELGAGFDGELSGIENIRLSCTIMGLSPNEIEERIPSIIQFAELSEFIEIPVKNYSSGMFARLGFACATAVDPDVLLVDEVLSVGDSNFGKKCLARIRKLQDEGTTIILVSHDPHAVMSFCDRALVFDQGKLVYQGPVKEALEKNEQIMDQRFLAAIPLEDRKEAARLRRLDAHVRAQNAGLSEPLPKVDSTYSLVQKNETVETVDAAQAFCLEFDLNIEHPERFQGEVSVGIGINSLEHVRIGGCNNIQLDRSFPVEKLLEQKEFKIKTVFHFPQGMPLLGAGSYELILGIHDKGISRNINTRVIGLIHVKNSILGSNLDRDIFDITSYLGSIDFVM